MNRPFQIREYGKIVEGQLNICHSTKELELNKSAFASIANFIEENQDQDGIDKAFSIGRKKGIRFISVKNYVGVIETTDGVVIEILPKTFVPKSGGEAEEADDRVSKHIMLKMLRTLKNSPFINLNIAHVDVHKNFPILEVFIHSFLEEMSKLAAKELRGDYVVQEDNIPFMKGKLLMSKHIKHNSIIQTKFYCEFDEFKKNIPPNKLLKSTLIKLLRISKSNRNKKRTIKLLQFFDGVDSARSLEADFAYCHSRKKHFASYGNLLAWSEIFLLNKSFTNFFGKSINQAILFPMEKLFESYIAHLLRKYCEGYMIETQDKKYYLVSQRKNTNDNSFQVQKFLLKPDVVINSDEVILDTKWKLLNENSKKNNIKEADIYQMHAYGRRYQSSSSSGSAPRLGLIYPWNPNFENELLQMRYGQDMYLDVVPFNFTNEEHKEIKRIVDIFFKNELTIINLADSRNIAAEDDVDYNP